MIGPAPLFHALRMWGRRDVGVTAWEVLLDGDVHRDAERPMLIGPP